MFIFHSQILNNKILASKAHGANKEVLSNNGEDIEKIVSLYHR